MDRDARLQQREERLDFETREESMGREILFGLVITAAIVGGFAYYEHGDWWSPLLARFTDRPMAAAQPKAQAGVPPAEAPLPPHHPVPEGTETGAPLPTLANSDDAMRNTLIDVFGRNTVGRYLDPERIIPKLVVTIDNLDRAPVPLKDRPVSNIPGQLQVKKAGGGFLLEPANAERYKPLILALKAADAQTIVRIYTHYYPLFQQAYRDLGYPNGEFNDRLIQVIDHLMQAPDIRGRIYLTRPKVLYEFVDEDLEARSSGHKLLIRMGPDNESLIKGKLNEIRHLLAPEKAAAPKRKPASPAPSASSQSVSAPAASSPAVPAPAPAAAPAPTVTTSDPPRPAPAALQPRSSAAPADNPPAPADAPADPAPPAPQDESAPPAPQQ